ncbi:hypothetical protein DFJ77DRAFT_443706 [Powellomyces hirtus]|nr:hypothetical protein DFJ77DRAFT_443706 [Powellomyces hirtus]
MAAPPTLTSALPSHAVACLWSGCTEKFQTEDDCFRHLTETHAQDGKQSCAWHPHLGRPVCNQSLRNRGNFADHVVTHFSTALRPIVCPLCPVRLRNRQDVKRHESRHQTPEQMAIGKAKPHRKRKISPDSASQHSQSPVFAAVNNNNNNNNSHRANTASPASSVYGLPHSMFSHVRSTSDMGFHSGALPIAAPAVESVFQHERNMSYPGSSAGSAPLPTSFPKLGNGSNLNLVTSNARARAQSTPWPPSASFAQPYLPHSMMSPQSPHIPHPQIKQEAAQRYDHQSGSEWAVQTDSPISPPEDQLAHMVPSPVPSLASLRNIRSRGVVSGPPTPATSPPMDTASLLYSTPMLPNVGPQYASYGHQQHHQQQQHLSPSFSTLQRDDQQQHGYLVQDQQLQMAHSPAQPYSLAGPHDPFGSGGKTFQQKFTWPSGAAGSIGSSPVMFSPILPSQQQQFTDSGALTRSTQQQQQQQPGHSRPAGADADTMIMNPHSSINVGIRTSVIQRILSVFFTLQPEVRIPDELMSFVASTERRGGYIPTIAVHDLFLNHIYKNLNPDQMTLLLDGFVSDLPSRSEYSYLIYRALTQFVRVSSTAAQPAVRQSSEDVTSFVFARCGREVIAAIRSFCNSEDPFVIKLLPDGFATCIRQMPLKEQLEDVSPRRIAAVLHLRRQVYRAYAEGITRDLEWLGGVGGWRAEVEWLPNVDIVGNDGADEVGYAVGTYNVRFTQLPPKKTGLLNAQALPVADGERWAAIAPPRPHIQQQQQQQYPHFSPHGQDANGQSHAGSYLSSSAPQRVPPAVKAITFCATPVLAAASANTEFIASPRTEHEWPQSAASPPAPAAPESTAAVRNAKRHKSSMAGAVQVITRAPFAVEAAARVLSSPFEDLEKNVLLGSPCLKQEEQQRQQQHAEEDVWSPTLWGCTPLWIPHHDANGVPTIGMGMAYSPSHRPGYNSSPASLADSARAGLRSSAELISWG